MEQVQGNLQLIRQVARKLRRRLPRFVELDELINDGYFGLARARRRFDASRGVPFRAFARRFIHGAMLDGLRRRDWFPRWLRESGSNPRMCSLNGEPVCTSNAQERVDQRDSLHRAMQSLPARQRLVLQLYYLHSMSQKQVAASLGISESRVSQLRNRTLQLLREASPI